MDGKIKRRTTGAGRLMIEALVAAGPRKSLEEYRRGAGELCEDVAGYCCVGDCVVFWICDGTGNSHELPGRAKQAGFNSRILAWDLGQGFGHLASRALTAGKEHRKRDLPDRLFAQTAEKWRGRLIAYFAGVEEEGKLGRLLSRMPEMGDGSYRMQWSSTFLGGIYDARTQVLDLINIGDSGAIVIGKRAQTVMPKETRGILFATFRQGSGLQIDVSSVRGEASWEHFRGVRGFIAVSDGLAKDLGVFLSEVGEAIQTQFSIDRIQREVSLSRGLLTYDDRAILVGRLMPGGRSVATGAGRRKRRGLS